MATQKGKTRGSFDYLLAIDCETTGLCLNSPSPVFNQRTFEQHQAISWGVIVADAHTLQPVEKLYVEVKWNDASKKQRKEDSSFGTKAEQIHGLDFQYLEKNGVSEEEAVAQIGNLIVKYWGPTVSIRTLGHNVHLFDLPFLRDLFERHDISLSFGNRHYDTNSIGFATFKSFTSDELFEAVGFEARGDHNALTDAEQALEATRIIRTIFQAAIKD